MKRPINVEVEAKKNEPIERTIKRFSKKVKKERIVEDYRERMYYEKPSEIKRRLKKRRKATLDKLKAKQETN
jgi:small subunit ribosomal protein S21